MKLLKKVVNGVTWIRNVVDWVLNTRLVLIIATKFPRRQRKQSLYLEAVNESYKVTHLL